MMPTLGGLLGGSLAAMGLLLGSDMPLRSGYNPERSGFTLEYRGETCGYRVTAIFALPGEEIDFSVRVPGTAATRLDASRFRFEAPGCSLRTLGPWRWRLASPRQTGLHALQVVDGRTQEAMRIHLFVLVPFKEVRNGMLNGYRIGQYPKVALHDLAIYRPPPGFIEITADNIDTAVSPHFTLRQFVCKQESDFPKYIVLRERLLYKLETLLERVNEAGFACSTFHVMSGYRTPHYNQAIGNVRYSRHVWGGAADIFIDVDGDGMMDDLNQDGRSDVEDARLLYLLFDGYSDQPWYDAFVGGLGMYRRSPAHGPFVHVDVRGTRARWGI